MKRSPYERYDVLPDARMDAWIWLYDRERQGGAPCDFSDQLGKTLALALRDEFFRLRDSESKQYLLSEETLKWITKEKRQIKWLFSYIESKLKCDILDCPPGLEGRNRVIASLDLWKCPLSEKNIAVKAMELAWYENRREDDLFDWFKDQEVLRVEFAWKWLVRKGKASDFKGAPISNLKDLLMFYDEIAADVSRKRVDIQDIKASWSLKKHAKKKKEQGKSQCNVWISNDAISKMDSLCEKFDLSRPEIIETLVQMEFEREVYLKNN